MTWVAIFVNIVLPVVIIFGVGYVLGRVFRWHHQTLSTLSLYILTPALIFQALYSHPEVVNVNFLRLFIAVSLLIGISFACVMLLAKVFRWEQGFARVVILTVTLANTGNFGLPITEAAFGAEGLAVASLLLVIYSLYTHTFGVFVAAREQFQWKEALKSMAGVPVFYAILLALALVFFDLRLPEPVFRPIQMIGLSAIPINLLQVGLQLASVKFEKQSLHAVTIAGVKLLLVPLLVIPLFWLLGIRDMYFKAGVLQVAMPSAVYTAILTTHYGGKSQFASTVVLLSVLASMVSLTAWIGFLQKGFF